ncbi:hypothetical protein [Ferrimicrobium acidiphilum]|uniref:hypothetical protein n=1 Tax=Ferrimicrobium acidiphilum TaxID=121039 RepID=UPI0023EFD782|nr:hypothetical protein [Ferrimicrobium acidiphilum]
MSENAIPDDGSSDTVDDMIQREWNQFASPDLSIDSVSLPTFLAPTPSSSTDKAGSPRQSRARRFRLRRVQGGDGQLEPPV